MICLDAAQECSPAPLSLSLVPVYRRPPLAGEHFLEAASYLGLESLSAAFPHPAM